MDCNLTIGIHRYVKTLEWLQKDTSNYLVLNRVEIFFIWSIYTHINIDAMLGVIKDVEFCYRSLNKFNIEAGNEGAGEDYRCFSYGKIMCVWSVKVQLA